MKKNLFLIYVISLIATFQTITLQAGERRRQLLASIRQEAKRSRHDKESEDHHDVTPEVKRHKKQKSRRFSRWGNQSARRQSDMREEKEYDDEDDEEMAVEEQSTSDEDAEEKEEDDEHQTDMPTHREPLSTRFVAAARREPSPTASPVKFYEKNVTEDEAIVQAHTAIAYRFAELNLHNQELCLKTVNNCVIASRIDYDSTEETWIVDQEKMIKKITQTLEVEEKHLKESQTLPSIAGTGISLRKLLCGHIFHVNCIRLQLRHYDKKCPGCKTMTTAVKELPEFNEKKHCVYIHPFTVKESDVCLICQEVLRKKNSNHPLDPRS